MTLLQLGFPGILLNGYELPAALIARYQVRIDVRTNDNFVLQGHTRGVVPVSISSACVAIARSMPAKIQR